MNPIRNRLLILALIASTTTSFAIEGLKLTIRCPDVVLSWPSTNDETYVVQYRPTLDTNSTWTTLTNFLPAKIGTNITTFVDSNRVDCPPGQVFGMLAIEGDGNSVEETETASLSVEQRAEIKKQREEDRLSALYKQCKLEGREPYDWELKNEPPPPPSTDDLRAKLLKATINRIAALSDGTDGAITDGPQPEGDSGGGGLTPTTGFYRVVRNGVHLSGVTNGQTVSGIVTLPIEVGFPYSPDAVIAAMLDPIDELQPNGVRTVDADEIQGIPTLVWDTAQVTNGNYVLRPAVVLAGNSVLTGSTVTVTVSNQIQIPDWPDTFGSGLPIRAIIASNNAPYQITIQNDQGTVVRTLTGIATGTVIDDFWDGLDQLGNDATDSQFVDVTISYNPSSKRRVRKELSNANLSGAWLVANQNLYPSGAVFNNNLNQIQIYAAGNGGTVSGSRFVIHTGNADWISFLLYLSHQSYGCRNLYYFGHGTPSSMGYGDNDRANGTKASQIAGLLGNNNLSGTNDYSTNHIFRFAFLDGCTTGAPNGTLPQAFGIQPVVRTTTAFAALGIQPRAFVGWKKNVYTTIFDTAHSTFVLNFFTEWIDNDETVDSALFRAASGTVGQTSSSGYPAIQIWGDPALLKQ
jgi:hypothetical protein